MVFTVNFSAVSAIEISPFGCVDALFSSSLGASMLSNWSTVLAGLVRVGSGVNSMLGVGVAAGAGVAGNVGVNVGDGVADGVAVAEGVIVAVVVSVGAGVLVGVAVNSSRATEMMRGAAASGIFFDECCWTSASLTGKIIAIFEPVSSTVGGLGGSAARSITTRVKPGCLPTRIARMSGCLGSSN